MQDTSSDPSVRGLESLIAENVLQIRRQMLDEEHSTILESKCALAKRLYADGDLPGARELLEEVLEVRNRLLGENDPGTIRSMEYLAVIVHAQGELVRARKLLQTAEQRRRIRLLLEGPGDDDDL